MFKVNRAVTFYHFSAFVAPFSKMKIWGPTEIWTRIAGFRVLSANHYTMGPLVAEDRFTVLAYITHALSKTETSGGKTLSLESKNREIRWNADGSKRGTNPRGMPTYYMVKISWKLHENEENRTGGGGRASTVLLCISTSGFLCQMSQRDNMWTTNLNSWICRCRIYSFKWFPR